MYLLQDTLMAVNKPVSNAIDTEIHAFMAVSALWYE